MRKTSKLIVALLIILTIATISISSFATTPSGILNTLKTDANLEGAGNKVGTFGQTIVTLARIVGTVIAVIILIVLGIKYMMGSAEEKAEYKKTMIPYIIGAILLFASTYIVTTILEISGALMK